MPFPTIDQLLAVTLVGSIGGGAWLFWRGRHNATDPGPTEPVPSPPSPSIPAGFLPVLGASDLFSEIRADALLFRIHQALGFAPENHARDVLPLLNQVAEFVQLLPASESHHHANPGGLLTHILEVAAVALLQAEESKLPIGRPTEEQLKYAARWRYGILVAALLHDVGKPIADVLIDVRLPNGAIGLWNGLGGKLGDYGDCYRVNFPLKRDYGAHQRLPVMLLKAMIPPSTMQWLADDPELVSTLIAYLSGESDGGTIGKLIKAADGKSVADNLLRGNRTRFATARQVPLIERMMDALRRMLAEGGQLPLNREGATGFCDGTDIWFVAGTLADKVRAYLDANEIREAGAADLPTDNSRLFDTWLDYAAVRDNAGAAIWKAAVTLDKEDGRSWSQTFTLLRFPLDKLYPNAGTYPQSLNGRVEVVAGAATHTAVDQIPEEPQGSMLQLAPAPVDPSSEQQPGPVSESPLPEFSLTPVTLEELSPSPAAVVSPQPTPMPLPAADEFLDAEESASLAMIPLPHQAEEPTPLPEIPTAPVTPAGLRVPQNSVIGDIPQPDKDIERLMAWIQQGIGGGTISYNRASACIHFVKEGMLLISPKVFREYYQAAGTEADATQIKRLQKLLQKSGYVAKNRPNSFLHYYRITNAKNADRSLVTGYLVTNPGLFFRDVPEANAHLEASAGNNVA